MTVGSGGVVSNWTSIGGGCSASRLGGGDTGPNFTRSRKRMPSVIEIAYDPTSARPSSSANSHFRLRVKVLSPGFGDCGLVTGRGVVAISVCGSRWCCRRFRAVHLKGNVPEPGKPGGLHHPSEERIRHGLVAMNGERVLDRLFLGESLRRANGV